MQKYPKHQELNEASTLEAPRARRLVQPLALRNLEAAKLLEAIEGLKKADRSRN